MRLAIAEAKRGFKQGQYAIGAVVVLNGKVLSVAHTTLDKTRDPSCHAEVNAIKVAAKKIMKRDHKVTWESVLAGAWLYSTFECCSMCASLAVWSNMEGIVYGNTMQEFFKANGMKIGKSHYVNLSTEDITKKGTPQLEVHGGFLKEECAELLTLRK